MNNVLRILSPLLLFVSLESATARTSDGWSKDPGNDSEGGKVTRPGERGYQPIRSASEALRTFKDVSFCISNSYYALDDSDLSCLVVKDNQTLMVHSSTTNYFQELNLIPRTEMAQAIESELYSVNIETYKTSTSFRVIQADALKTASAELNAEPIWYIESLAMCTGAYNRCKGYAKKWDDWLGWFSFLFSNGYEKCELGIKRCKEHFKQLKKAEVDVIRDAVKSVASRNGSNGSGSGGIGSGIEVGEGTCYGWTVTCSTIGENKVCDQKWEQVGC